METHRVADGGEVLGSQFGKILVDVLVWKIAAEERTVDLTIIARQLSQGSLIPPLLEELE